MRLPKKIYAFHRTMSLVIAIPVALWALSGMMHPLMTSLRPSVATQTLEPDSIDRNRVGVTVSYALKRNRIDSIQAVRLVHIDTNWFYQVKTEYCAVPVYMSVRDGRRLSNGDALYARWLARQFMGAAPRPDRKQYASLEVAMMDCCDAATACAMDERAGSKIRKLRRVDRFEGEYNAVNRYLPVYRVDFERDDELRVYVSTWEGKFALAVDRRRAVFDRVFALFHTWSWLDGMGRYRHLVVALIMLVTVLTTLAGLLIFFQTRTRRGSHPVVKARRWHRYTSLTASLFTLAFAFSGGYHAFKKISEPGKAKIPQQRIAAQPLDIPWPPAASSLRQANLVMLTNGLYWRLNTGDGVRYVSEDTTPLVTTDSAYALTLASWYSGRRATEVKDVQFVTKFSGEYGFLNKRLPVWSVNYGNERYYVDLASGELAAHVRNEDRAEGFSFAFLHKHHFMDFAGKTARDASTVFGASLQVAMVLVGLMLYFRIRERRRKAGLE